VRQTDLLTVWRTSGGAARDSPGLEPALVFSRTRNFLEATSFARFCLPWSWHRTRSLSL